MYGRIPYLNNSLSFWATHCFNLRCLLYSTAVWLGASPSVPLTHEGHSSCISCLYAQTSHTQYLPAAFQTSTSTCNHWWRTRIWNLQDSRLQDWPLEGMQTALQGYMTEIQRYWQQLWMVTSNRTRTYKEITQWFPSPIFLQTRTTTTLTNS